MLKYCTFPIDSFLVNHWIKFNKHETKTEGDTSGVLNYEITGYNQGQYFYCLVDSASIFRCVRTIGGD